MTAATTPPRILYIGRQRIGVYGMDNEDVSGYVSLFKKHRNAWKRVMITTFESRIERQLAMIKMRLEFNLFKEKHDGKYYFKITII